MEQKGNTLLIGRELLNDLRLPALTEIMQESFRVRCITILARTGQSFDLPDCLDQQSVDRIPVHPVDSSWVTQHAKLEQALPLMRVIHVQSHPDLYDSVAVHDSLNRPLQLHQIFPYEMVVKTMGELMQAINRAHYKDALRDRRLKPLTRRERVATRRSAIRRDTDKSLAGWSTYVFDGEKPHHLDDEQPKRE
ncbi:hypothetical protein AUJ46_03595 [Candidatus Peregrinibacteria bacterium CG1_02_54_53]|nr:MAG: hypothetical protein AUJ46_03595 [Candidatus Peregrinibacteria bacterium CG1_02_54_53]